MSQQQGASEPEDSDLLSTAEYATGGDLISTGDTTELPRDTSATEQSDSASPTHPPTVHSAGSSTFTTSSVAITPGPDSIFPVKQHSTSPPRKILKPGACAYYSLHPDTWKQSTHLYKRGNDRFSQPLALGRRRVEQQKIRLSPKDYDVKQHEQKEAEKKTESKKRLELGFGSHLQKHDAQQSFWKSSMWGRKTGSSLSQQQGESHPKDSELLSTTDYATGDPAKSPRDTSTSLGTSGFLNTPPHFLNLHGCSPVIRPSGALPLHPSNRRLCRQTTASREILKQDVSAEQSFPRNYSISAGERSRHRLSLHQGASRHHKAEPCPTTEYPTGDPTELQRHTSATVQSSSGAAVLSPPLTVHSAGSPPFTTSFSAGTSGLNNFPVWQHSTSPTEEILKQDAGALFSKQSESSPDGDGELSAKADPRTVTEHLPTTNTLPAPPHLQLSSRDSCVTRKISHLSRCHSMSSLSKIPRTENKLTQPISLPDILYKEFTPVITADEDDETYRFQCSSPGLYLCSVTGLMFDMKGEGDVVYRIVPWNRRLLVQHHKKPAGPLFDITCVQQCVSQLHLPHCEISSTGGAQFLSVAHVSDDGDVEFIRPQKVTETHVVISITGFSGYGNVKDEDSPPEPVRALVLLFYRPPADPDADLTCFLNVLLAPGNVVLRDVLRFRKKINGHEMFIEASPYCNLKPKKVYRLLLTSPQDDSVKIQPRKVRFHEESHSNYLASFQVILETFFRKIKLQLKDKNSTQTVWKRRVYLPPTGERSSPGQRALNLPPNKRLLHVRRRFVNAISGPVLNSLLDKLLEKKVITDSERESVDAEKTRGDKARVVIDTVRKKGEAASSEMIEFLCELDPFLCKYLGLK